VEVLIKDLGVLIGIHSGVVVHPDCTAADHLNRNAFLEWGMNLPQEPSHVLA
jgi:hypothetical protein